MTAIRATYSDLKLVKTRKVVQLIFEIPIEAADHAIKVLGGLPRPDAETWVAIAPITEEAATRTPPPAEKPRKRIGDMSRTAQAGMLCNSEEFHAFLDSRFRRVEKTATENAAAIVRKQCQSLRRHLDTDADAGKRWDQFRLDYDVWRRAIAAPR